MYKIPPGGLSDFWDLYPARLPTIWFLVSYLSLFSETQPDPLI